MDKFALLTVILVFIASAIQPGSSLKCYKCDSAVKDHPCLDPFNKDGKGVEVVDCQTTNSVCRKTITGLSGSTALTTAVDGHVERDCFVPTAARTGANEATETTKTLTCSKDYCNSASFLDIKLVSLISGVSLTFLAKFVFG